MTKQFTGGASIDADQIQINLYVGGQTQTRAYNTIHQAVDRLVIISEALSKIPIESTSDAIFYTNQLVTLFRPTQVSFLPNIGTYQTIHNIHTLNIYIQSCMDPFSPSESLQLLNHNRIVSELKSDTSENLSCGITFVPNISKDHIDELCNTTTENIVIASRHLRNTFNQYVQMIVSEKKTIDLSSHKLIEQINNELAP